MTLVRILVDGHGLLQKWKDLALGKTRHSEAAREELIHWLTWYSDAVETPVSIVWGMSSVEPAWLPPASQVELVFSAPGQTAGRLMERLARRMAGRGPFLAVVDDAAIQDKVRASGGAVSNCEEFLRMVQAALATLELEIASLNQKENEKFTQHG